MVCRERNIQKVELTTAPDAKHNAIPRCSNSKIIFLTLHERYFGMPELFRMFGLRFFFFSNEHLPIHVRVKNADGTAKFEVDPVTLIENKGIKK